MTETNLVLYNHPRGYQLLRTEYSSYHELLDECHRYPRDLERWNHYLTQLDKMESEQRLKFVVYFHHLLTVITDDEYLMLGYHNSLVTISPVNYDSKTINQLLIEYDLEDIPFDDIDRIIVVAKLLYCQIITPLQRLLITFTAILPSLTVIGLFGSKRNHGWDIYDLLTPSLLYRYHRDISCYYYVHTNQYSHALFDELLQESSPVRIPLIKRDITVNHEDASTVHLSVILRLVYIKWKYGRII